MPKIVKVKRSTVAGSTPTLSYGELGWNSADAKLYAGNAANQAVLVNTPSVGGGGGGGSPSLVVAATTADFPASGSSANLYCSSDTQRVFRWDSANAVYVEVGPLGGGGSGGGGSTSPATASSLGTVIVGSGLAITGEGVLSASDPRWSLFSPAPPTGVTPVAGSSEAVVSWTASSSTSPPVTGYVVQYSSNAGTSWTTFSGTATSTGATVTGLTNGTAYVIRVAAVSGIGEGAWSTVSGEVTPSAYIYRPIPTMTGNTSPSGQASASPQAAGEVSQPPYLAFDDNDGSYVGMGYTKPFLLQYDFGEGVKSFVSGYSFRQPQVSSDRWMQAWLLEGSDDGSTYVTLDSRSNQSFTTALQTFSLGSSVAYRMFRLKITEVGYNSGTTFISSFQLLQ